MLVLGYNNKSEYKVKFIRRKYFNKERFRRLGLDKFHKISGKFTLPHSLLYNKNPGSLVISTFILCDGIKEYRYCIKENKSYIDFAPFGVVEEFISIGQGGNYESIFEELFKRSKELPDLIRTGIFDREDFKEWKKTVIEKYKINLEKYKDKLPKV